jgi:spore germination cell wall hydrolase CwlJ-like protein
MTMVSNDAAGAEPADADLRVFRTAGEMAIGLPLAAAAVAVLSLAVLPQAPAELKAPVQTAAQAVQAVRPLIPAEGLADPPAATQGASVDSRAIVRSLLKQAGLRPSLDPHRLSWDQARKVNALLPADRTPTGVAEPFRLDTATPNGRQALKCLTQAAYFEAGANGPVAEAAVVQVVLNRLRHPDFPKSVCGVVYQGSDDQGCQFSFTCDGAQARPIDVAAWNEARKVAQRALNGYVVKAVGTATYYHADYVFPAWATSLVKMATVGPHIFYRMAGPAGAAAYFNGRYAGNELKLARAILRAGQKPKQKADVQLAAAVTAWR